MIRTKKNAKTLLERLYNALLVSHLGATLKAEPKGKCSICDLLREADVKIKGNEREHKP